MQKMKNRKNVEIKSIAAEKLKESLKRVTAGDQILVSRKVIDSATTEERMNFWKFLQDNKLSFQYLENISLSKKK